MLPFWQPNSRMSFSFFFFSILVSIIMKCCGLLHYHAHLTHTHTQNRRNCWNVDTFIRPNATKWKREMGCGESNQPISNAHGAIPFWLLVFIKSISLLLSSSCSIHFVYLFLLIYLSSFYILSSRIILIFSPLIWLLLRICLAQMPVSVDSLFVMWCILLRFHLKICFIRFR